MDFQKFVIILKTKKDALEDTAFLSATSGIGAGLAFIDKTNIHNTSTVMLVAGCVTMVTAIALAYIQKNELQLNGLGAKVGKGISDILDRASKTICLNKDKEALQSRLKI